MPIKMEEMRKVTDTFWAEREVIRPCTSINMKKRSYSLPLEVIPSQLGNSRNTKDNPTVGSFPLSIRKKANHTN